MDVFSKFAWAYPLKNKTGISITDAFKDIIKRYKRKQKYVCVDDSSEFCGLTKMILICITL